MTDKAGRERSNEAEEHYEQREFGAASDTYVQAAYQSLGHHGLTQSAVTVRGLHWLLRAVGCARQDGDDATARKLAWQGVHVARLIGDRQQSRPPASHAHDQAERGVWYEFEADFRVLGGLPDADDAYDRAATVYREAGDPRSFGIEQTFMAAVSYPKLLFRGYDLRVDELEDLHPSETTLTQWIAFLRDAFPEVVEAIAADVEWTYPY